MLPIAILAGGLATRLHPLTVTIPKSLIPVAGEPFLAHQLRLLQRHGAQKVVLCLGHLGEQIEEVFGDGSRLGLELVYIHDGPKLRGTGGAVAQALPWLGEEFFVLYGDSYLPVNLAEVQERFLESDQPALMTVYENRGRFDRSNVLFSGGDIVRYDKHAPTPEMHHIDYGLSAFEAATFAGREEAVFDLSELQQELVEKGKMAGFLTTERFYEIGSHEGLADLEAFLTKEHRE